MIHLTTKITLYIFITAFFTELHPERDHTELHQVWHDTLAPT